MIEDTPYRLISHGRVWEPRNYDGTFAGPITLRQALQAYRDTPLLQAQRSVE